MSERKNQARWLGLLGAIGIALYLCWLMLEPFVGVLSWAAVLVIVFHPLHRRLVERTGRPSLSALVSCLVVIVVILAPLTFITLALLREFSGAAQNLQAYVAALLDPNSPTTGKIWSWLGQYVDIEPLRSGEFLRERLQGLSGNIARSTIGVVGGVVGAVVQVVFIIFTMYYLFRDGGRIVRRLPEVLPLERAQGEVIIARTNDVIGASVYGVLVIAVIQGVLGGLAFFFLGLPSALVWGVVMIFLSMIPVAGAFVVWVPAAIFLAATGHWVRALILVALGVFVIGTVDNFLRPKLVGERTKLHELMIFFSVLGGLQVFGVLGLVLGPVVLAVTLALLDVVSQSDRSGGESIKPSTLAEPSAAPPPAPDAVATTVG